MLADFSLANGRIEFALMLNKYKTEFEICC